jgi:hypothetical protein
MTNTHLRVSCYKILYQSFIEERNTGYFGYSDLKKIAQKKGLTLLLVLILSFELSLLQA